MDFLQSGTANTIAQAKKTIGGAFPVWSRVRELYQGGGYIDVKKSGLKPGDVIGAGTMCKFKGAGKEVEFVTIEDKDGAAEVVILNVLTGANTAGKVTVAVGGVSVATSVLATDATPESIAKKVAAGSYTGWTAAADGARVIFTASAVGVKDAPTLDTAATGVVAEINVQVAGKAAGEANYTGVNGLVFEDVCIPDGCIHATCAVVRAGRIYADRVMGGGLPTEIEKNLPMIEFVREK